ncbi:hypothetical protein NEIPOLOT_02022, partial [Neisseria polysaccharea ATCC 43768]
RIAADLAVADGIFGGIGRAGGNPGLSVSVISKNCRSVKFLDSHFRGNDERVEMAKGRE